MPTAIVTGATDPKNIDTTAPRAGILGSAIVQALGKEPEKWTKVYALSRSQKQDYPANVELDFVDLLSSAEDMAKQLQGIEADYCFFAAYLQKDTEEELTAVNGMKHMNCRLVSNTLLMGGCVIGAMLRNFLDALDITGASKKLKRVLLTTGAKQYGVQLGQVKNPMEETDPWLEGKDWPPNFYYAQQRILEEKSRNSGSYDWVVTYPNDVIGVAEGNFMNLVTALGIYCAVSKELGGDLIFPGSERFYTGFDSFTYGPLHADFNLWAAEKPEAGNQTFNMVNGEAESWQNLWPKIAKRFNCQIPKNQFKVETQFESLDKKLADHVPIEIVAASIGLEGASFADTLSQKVDLVKWSKHPAVVQAWEQIRQRHGLKKGVFEKATWSFLGFVLGRNYDIVVSMSKARRLGWTGFFDNYEAFDVSFEQLERLNILPRAA
ncbi:hypothetical protein ABW19_dt0209670 [Dactylella cylindrospora]|nr:hypothetical protein ABW19_dt0209670 [Dactylella cylindrospora]